MIQRSATPDRLGATRLPPAQVGVGAPSTARPSVLVIAAGLLFAAVIWAGLHFHIAERERAALAQAGRDAANLALALEEQVDRTILGLDQVLRFTQGEIAEKGAAFDLAAFSKRLTSLEGVSHQISITDAAGTLVATSLETRPAKPVSIADREHFKVHRENDAAGLFVSRPLLGRASGRWSIQLSRRLNAADGGFAGVIVISLDPDYLSGQFATIDVGEGGSIALFGQDGIVRARSPYLPGLYEGNLTTRIQRSNACADLRPSVTIPCRLTSSLDGVDRVYAYRTLGHLPLVVSVGKSVAAIEAQLGAERRRAYWLGGLITLALVCALGLLVRELEQRRRREAQLRQSERALREKSSQLEVTLETMDQGLIVIDAERRIPIVNRRAVELLDLPAELMAAHPRYDDVVAHQVESGEFDGADATVWTFLTAGGLEPEHHVFERVRPNGTALEIRTVPLSEGGAVRTYTDITARKRADEAVSRAEALFRGLFDHATDGLFVHRVDPQTGATELETWNATAAKLLGCAPEEATSRRLEDLLPAHAAAETRAHLAETLKAGAPLTFVGSSGPEAGGRSWEIVHVPVRDPVSGAITRIFASVRDVTHLKAAEAEAREANRLLRMAEGVAHVGHWRLDWPSGALFWSDEVYRIHGHEPGAVRPHLDIAIAAYHPDDRGRVAAAIRGARDSVGSLDFAARLVRPDGEVRHVVVRGFRQVDERDADRRSLFGVMMDVSDRVRAEAQVRESEARLRFALDAGRMYAWERDVASNRVTRSGGVAEVLGFVPSDSVDAFNESVHSDDLAVVRTATEAAIHDGSPYEVEFRFRRPDGTQIWLADVGRRVRMGDQDRFMGLCFDITGRRAAEDAMRASEERHRMLADHATDMVVEAGLDTVRRYVSPACRELLGYEPEELVGTKPLDAVHPEDAQRYAGLIGDLVQGRVDQLTSTQRYRHKNGAWIWVEVRTRLVRDEATGAPVSYVAAVRDVSERQAQAQALLEAKEAAEAASQAKTDFLASMSHEIRTPLNGVLGYADLLLGDRDLNDSQRRHLERVQTAGSALLTVVNDILDFSKIEAGQVELDAQAFPLAALVDNTVSITRGLAERKGLAFQVELDPDLPARVMGDQDRLRQVLLNLINNAVKFTQTGSVTLKVALDEPAGDASRIRFSVTDTGLGIPRDKLPRLFQRFSQVDGSVRREFGGTGLGLAISKRLVDLMGGRIGVESEHLQGSTFWFTATLPPVDAQAAPDAAGAERVPAARYGRLLLVEDLDINRDLARAILEAAGHEVDTVGDGADAVMAVQAKAYDLVLMDVQMPGMDGLTATQHIRALAHPAARVPIVAMTANVLPAQVAQFRAAGMDDHVGKPFKRDDLLAAVQRWLTAQSQEEEAGSATGQTDALDAETYAELLDMLGRDRMLEMLAGLSERLTDLIPAQGASAGPLDPGELAREAHKLVSAAGMLGFREVSALCAALESACKAGAELGPLLAQVGAARARALHAIEGLREAA